MAIFTNRNLQNTRHEVMDFDGEWRASFGTPSPTGAWLIYGHSGSGKTVFALKLANYLTNFGRVLYWSIEQGNKIEFQNAVKIAGIDIDDSRIAYADEEETFESIIKTMTPKRGREILIVDSLTPLRTLKFDIMAYEKFRRRMRGKLIIWLSHEKNGEPDTGVGQYIRTQADLKMRIEGFRAAINTRSGKRLDDFISYKEGWEAYSLSEI